MYVRPQRDLKVVLRVFESANHYHYTCEFFLGKDCFKGNRLWWNELWVSVKYEGTYSFGRQVRTYEFQYTTPTKPTTTPATPTTTPATATSHACTLPFTVTPGVVEGVLAGTVVVVVIVVVVLVVVVVKQRGEAAVEAVPVRPRNTQ
ncbi:hypothetical protein O3P69_003381 [Scylla paramamosain]|uniref:Uncharacterized protein n=1 Tax=Scylla paramamosain TaxID=85552 RepID=A0AAW0UGD1_SCYPA